MKKKLFIAFITSILTLSYTNSFAQVEWGVRAGYQMTKMNVTSEGKKLKEFKFKPNFHAGVTAAINLADEFFLQPALLYSSKGSICKTTLMPDDINFSLGYLELPIHFLYKSELGKGKLLLGVGPYIAYGLTGKLKMGSASEKITFGKDDEDYLKPLDFGGSLMAGYEFSNRISVQLNGQLGMVDIATAGDSDNFIKNMGFGISVGYKLK